MGFGFLFDEIEPTVFELISMALTKMVGTRKNLSLKESFKDKRRFQTL